MKEESTEKKENMYEEEIRFYANPFYSKVRGYLNKDKRMKGYSGKGYKVYLTNQVKQSHIPYSIVLSEKGMDNFNNLIGTVSIEKNHPFGEQIRKDLEKIIKENRE